MKIRIVCVGRLKEKYWQDALKEYQKRLGAYVNLEICEVNDEKTPDRASLKECEQIKNREGERLLAKIKPNDHVVLLDLKGKMLSSEDLSAQIERYMLKGQETIDYVIGGSLGVSEQVKARANEMLCFSKMTFPHQMMRVILLEQIYRGFKIMRHEPYHK